MLKRCTSTAFFLHNFFYHSNLISLTFISVRVMMESIQELCQLND